MCTNTLMKNFVIKQSGIILRVDCMFCHILNYGTSNLGVYVSNICVLDEK